MKDVLAIIMGGGKGSRLHPLTLMRAKPAVPIGAKYRLIDIPISNCLNSGISKIYILTQFNSASLNRHISQTYFFSHLTDGFVEILAAQQTPASEAWFQGTADAVRRNLSFFKEINVDDYLVLAGDHLYRMDYHPFIDLHRSTRADVTIPVIAVDQASASGYGLIKINEDKRIVNFVEKPKGAALDAMRVDTRIFGLGHDEAAKRPYIASMGIYAFRRDVLLDLLQDNAEMKDFGKEIIPEAIKNCRVQSFLYDGYWEDIGTIRSFYEANLALLKHPNPHFSFFDPVAPIYSRPRLLPSTKILNARIKDSMIAEGCIIDAAAIEGSIIGVRSIIGENVEIYDSLIMGADYYDFDEAHPAGARKIGIGANSVIRNAIIDKNARIGRNVRILNANKVDRLENQKLGCYIRDGIVVVIKNAVIPDDTVV